MKGVGIRWTQPDIRVRWRFLVYLALHGEHGTAWGALIDIEYIGALSMQMAMPQICGLDASYLPQVSMMPSLPPLL